MDALITEWYGTEAECPWPSAPTYAVYRHADNHKWFAVIMELPKEKLGLSGGKVNVVNLKCDPLLIGSLLMEEGIHKGYHMNKNYWISVRLDGSVEDDKLAWLLELSFKFTSKNSNM